MVRERFSSMLKRPTPPVATNFQLSKLAIHVVELKRSSQHRMLPESNGWNRPFHRQNLITSNDPAQPLGVLFQFGDHRR